MDRAFNRAEQLWKNWEEQQKQLLSLTGIQVDERMMNKLKYDFLRYGLYRLSVNPTEKEKLFIKVIRTVTSKLQKQTFPNRLGRWLHQARVLVVDKPDHVRAFVKTREENIEQLKGMLEWAGFATHLGKLENQLDYERPQIAMRAVGRTSDNDKLEMLVHLEKDRYGSYQYRGYDLNLVTESGEKIGYSFAATDQLKLMEAVNLLQGRAIYKSYENTDGTATKKWVQIDLPEKNSDQPAELITFSPKLDFDLKRTLVDHAVKLEHYGITKEQIQKSLEEGCVISLDLPGKGKCYVQASPMKRGLLFYDQDKRPIAFETLIKNPESKPSVTREFKLIKQNELPAQVQMTMNK